MAVMRLLALCFLVLLASTPLAGAQAFDNYITRVSIDSLGDASMQVLVSFDSTGLSEVSLPIYSPRGVHAFDATGALPYRVEGGRIIITTSQARPNYGITLEYSTSSLTSKSGETWAFGYSLASQGPAEVRLALPANAAILSVRPEGTIYAAGDIFVEWGIDAGSAQELSVIYRLDQVTSPRPENTPDIGPVLLGAAAAAMAAVVVLYLRRPKEGGSGKATGMSEAQGDILKTLSENERKVVETLLGDGGQLTQKKVFMKTGIPKSTLSRTIKSLQMKDLIEIYDVGLTNSLKLKKWFMEKQ
ncbi:MAG: hypothetical protein HY367_01785 [Candidatus Aenigmarchaeota archaeon]|nr:hypothetical protein [Candidatus Aenigmarchaeota archaeon]